ncbi:BRCT domain-containing protein [Pseudodesulfovibrio sp.]|uniref:BRCT domain-containing protein n=1 Tax=unclassified Pseudodesulfovibrio TaxID=2661612 RepID=UPI003B00A3BD
MSKFYDQNGQPVRNIHAARVSTRTVDELIGLSKGIIADGTVSEAEALFLVQWLQENYDMASDDFVVQTLGKRVSAMLEDGVIDAEERKELFEILSAATGSTTGSTAASTALPLDSPKPAVKFYERSFVLTGKFASGTRTFCQDIITDLGGVPQKSVTLSTNYVVIGELGSRDWKHSSHGTKIMKAVEYRERPDTKISLISEEYWAECIRMCLK